MRRAAVLLLLLSACSHGPAGPSLVIITLDTTRQDALGCYGNPLGTTPHLDALAQKGFVFDAAYAPMPQTLPSHCTLFTGLPPRSHGAVENARTLSKDVETLAEDLQARDWETAAFVGCAVVSSETGIQQGFASFDEPHGVGRDSQHEVERSAEAVTDAALYWAGRREDPERPYFLWAHYYDAHGPYEPAHERIPLAAVRTLLDRHMQASPGEVQGAPVEEVAKLWHGYLNEVAEVDAQVGRLIDGLRAKGLLANAAILIVGDHGEGLMDHGEKSHGAVIYQELMEVPLLLLPPGAAAGKRVAAPLEMQDVLPTLFAAAGLGAPPAGLQGRDHWPEITGSRPVTPEPMIFERPFYLPGEQRAMRADAHDYGFGLLAGVVLGTEKLVRYPDNHEDLFDLAADPGELRSVAAERPDSRARLAQILDDWLARHPPPGSGEEASPERLEVLKSLGYTGHSPATPVSQPAPAKCGHAGCHCPVPAGLQFCSDSCRAQAGSAQAQICGCGQAGCGSGDVPAGPH